MRMNPSQINKSLGSQIGAYADVHSDSNDPPTMYSCLVNASNVGKNNTGGDLFVSSLGVTLPQEEGSASFFLGINHHAAVGLGSIEVDEDSPLRPLRVLPSSFQNCQKIREMADKSDFVPQQILLVR